MNESWIGIDIGTTATKTVAFNREGSPIASAMQGYPLLTEEPGAAEQIPEDILKAVITTVREVAGQIRNNRPLTGICFSTAMHTLLALDAAGKPCSRIITWADQRATQAAKDLAVRPEGKAFYQKTGTPIHAMSPLCKLKWLRTFNPGLLHKAARWVSVKEYLIHYFFGVFVVDHATASATGLFNIHRRTWDDEILAELDLPRSAFSTPVPTTFQLGPLLPGKATELAIPGSTPFIIGATDGVLANLGLGVTGPGRLAVSVGTSAAIRATVTKPVLDPGGKLFCYILDDERYVVGGAMNNAGLALQWFTQNVLKNDPAALLPLITEAEKIPAGSDNLLFLPYLTGERPPFDEGNSRGAFIGLTIRHTQEHLARAVMEGVIYHLHWIAELLSGMGVSGGEIRATGGFSRSSLWPQILADMLGERVSVSEHSEGSSYGAALLARQALESEAPSVTISTKTFAPLPGNTETYARLYPVFKRLYTDLGPAFTCL